MNIIKTILIISIVLLSLIMPSCNNTDKIAPPSPAKNTLITDFSIFENKNLDSRNWSFLKKSFESWDTILNSNLLIPITSYSKISENNTPVYQENNTWLWTSDFKVDINNYIAKLYGAIKNDTISWKMYISKEGSYTDFLWLKGFSNTNITEGKWYIYDKPPIDDYVPHELLVVDWMNVDTINTQYSYIVPEDNFNGNYISFKDIPSDNLNIHLAVFDKAQDDLINAQWNESSKYGQVKNLKFFTDSSWHCWDNNFNDIICD